MGRLLFAAHDPGGANLLLAVMAAARAAGHRLSLVPAGPAETIWRAAGEAGVEVVNGAGVVLDRLAPDLVVTATGFGGYERHLWLSARERGIGSVALIDAWTNLRRRFFDPDGDDAQPDVLGVIDEAMRDEIIVEDWCRSRLCVTGQPHLQAMTRRLERARQGRRPAERPILAFFSEPVRQDHGGVDILGYDQFTAADAILAGLAGAPPLTLLVQPHPRENPDDWRDWRAAKGGDGTATIVIGDGAAETVLAGCDAVLGVTTMVLVEAALAGIPALAVQPGRRRVVNPLLDRIGGVVVVTDPRAVAQRLSRLLRDRAHPIGRDRALAEILENADGRVVNVIDAELQKKAKPIEKKRDS
jgi:hypothetical protein